MLPGSSGRLRPTLWRDWRSRLQSRADRFETDAVAVQLLRIDFHADGGLRTAADEDLADAFDLRELLREDGIRGVVHLRRRNIVRSSARSMMGASAGFTLR